MQNDIEELVILDASKSTDEWELDCYSRPVLVAGKKLWEVLVTDSNSSFRYRCTLPSSQVNSKRVREIVEQLIETLSTTDLQRPTVIRFFRGAMYNMLSIALNGLEEDVTARASRCTYALADWLQERHAKVYPNMSGYQASMTASSVPSFLDVRTPIRMPDSLRGEQYAFVSLPWAEFMPGGGVTTDNIGVGRLCPIPASLDIAGDAFCPGVVILTPRAEALARWLAGTELVGLSADLRKRVLIMETDVDTQYSTARLNEVQRTEAATFEQGKRPAQGMHFVSVQVDEEADPAGFWLLRNLPSGI
jgi:RNA-binding protein Tab2/Atab2